MKLTVRAYCESERVEVGACSTSRDEKPSKRLLVWSYGRREVIRAI